MRRFPTWSGPEGLGAKRPTGTGSRILRAWLDLWGIWHCRHGREERRIERMAARDVVLVVFPGLQGLDLIGPGEVFAAANDEVGRAAYRLRVVAAARRPAPHRRAA